MSSVTRNLAHPNAQGASDTAKALGYQLEIAASPLAVEAASWDGLLARQSSPSLFMQWHYLAALHASGSATPETGWLPQFILLSRNEQLRAACPLYVKHHSWGEYVFDFAWARAHQLHGLPYYPKAVVAVPFTPVAGARLLATSPPDRQALLQVLLAWCQERDLSSLHVLYGDAADLKACEQAGLMRREQLQFHWHNQHPGQGRPFNDFEDFLMALARRKRKNIRQERRRVCDADVHFRHAIGDDIRAADWDFFYRCYRQTYLEHGHPPYLTPAFFAAMQRDMPGHWMLFIAEHDGQPMACSLVGLQQNASGQIERAYGRYWGSLRHLDCLHFEACYYQPIAWCIEHGVPHFEGGAQGPHKLARGLLPQPAHSAHWLARTDFARAVEDHLEDETAAMREYEDLLRSHSPFRR